MPVVCISWNSFVTEALGLVLGPGPVPITSKVVEKEGRMTCSTEVASHTHLVGTLLANGTWIL